MPWMMGRCMRIPWGKSKSGRAFVVTVLSRRDLFRISAAGAITAAATQATAAKESEKPEPRGDRPTTPPIRARMFWTWDHSTEWALNRPGAQTYGAANAYTRSKDMFLQDYTNLFHWCGRHGIDAVVVWGLFAIVMVGSRAPSNYARWLLERTCVCSVGSA